MRYWHPPKIVGKPLVGIAVATYDQPLGVPVMAACLRAQTYPHFLAAFVHDGPAGPGIKPSTVDSRFFWSWTIVREECFGHNCRLQGWKWLAQAGCKYLASTNADNYYVPVWLDEMVGALQKNKAQIAYCSAVHSHKHWAPLDAAPVRGKIDIGSWVAETDLVMKTPWEQKTFAGDWFFFDKMLKTKGVKAVKVPKYLFVHN